MEGLCIWHKGGDIMQRCTLWHKVSQDALLSWCKGINNMRLNVSLPPPKGRRAVESLQVLRNMFDAEDI